MKSFFKETLRFFFETFLVLLHFGSSQNCMSSVNTAAEIHQKLCNKRPLSAEEPCTGQYVTLLQSFHRVTLSIHCYIAQSVQFTFSISVLFRCFFQIAIFSRFLMVAIATSNFLNEVENDKFVPEFSVSIVKEIITLVRDYESENKK